MAVKAKPGGSFKKLQNSLPMKEVFQQNQLTTELLKIISARSEDIVVLRSISDKKTGKLRLQTSFAEKNVQEIESKEEWRLSREDQILSQLINGRLEAPLYKKQFEKLTRKMIKINSQFEDDPTNTEMNLSEINVQKIMNIKIGPENTFITYNDKGQPCATVPSASVPSSSWRDNFSKSSKLLESCLFGESILLYPTAYFCVQTSRSNYFQELAKQKLALEEGSNLLSPNILVIITKKSKPSITSTPSPVRKLITLPEPDYKNSLFRMFIEMNAETQKKIRDFRALCSVRIGESRVERTANKIEKALRLRNYEKCAAVRPSGNSTKIPLNTVRTRIHLTTMPQIAFDLDNPYFEESKSLADRVRIVHFCIFLQRRFRCKRNSKLGVKAVVIQKHVRGFLVRKHILLEKTEKFRKIFHWARLKNWYPLLVNRLKERKGEYMPMNYNLFLDQILKIQKNFRGALARKVVKWKKEFYQLRKKREFERFHQKKIKIWKLSLLFEQRAVEFSGGREKEIREVFCKVENGKGGDDGNPAETVKMKEKSEMHAREELLGSAKMERIQFFEYFGK